MMKQMYAWSKDENECIRRLASEGCRPALPWGQALTGFKKDPAPILPILRQLKADPSLHVRKSVANNLNDISKTHPDLVMELAKDWYGKNAYTDWIVKHGCRTLLKKAAVRYWPSLAMSARLQWRFRISDWGKQLFRLGRM